MKKIVVILILLIIFLIYNTFFSDNFIHENFDNNILHTIVDKVYVINMDKDKERMYILDKKMKELGIKYQRATGVDGRKIYSQYKNKTKLRPGQLGCLLSHINVIKDAIKNNYENILVLEDDIIFHKNFHKEFKKKYRYLIEKEKYFDLIYLGCHQKHNWKNINILTHYYKTKKNDGTFAMLINKNIFQDILENYNKLNQPSDRVLYYNIQPNKKCFTFHPNILTSNVSNYSNTEEILNSVNLSKYLKSNKIEIKNYDFKNLIL